MTQPGNPPIDSEENTNEKTEGQESIKSIKALESYRKKEPNKSAYLSLLISCNFLNYCTVVVRFKAVGNAPIMRQNFYKINSTNRFQAVIQFLRRELGWPAGDALVCAQSVLLQQWSDNRTPKFTYINLAFSPAPDDTVSNLYKVRLLFGENLCNS